MAKIANKLSSTFHSLSLKSNFSGSVSSYIGGHRCLVLPAVNSLPLENGDAPPPIIMLGGTAQTIQSWLGHYNYFSKHRDVIVVELRGQGNNPNLSPDDVRIESQVTDLSKFLSHFNYGDQPIDLIGFSFGGRVAMAYAAEFPKLVHKIVVTSVGGDRGGMGRIIYEQWKYLLSLNIENKFHLSSSSLEPFAWSSIISTYHPNFLLKNEIRIKKWIQLLIENNTQIGIHNIVTQTFNHDLNIVARKCKQNNIKGKLIYGEHDLLLNVSTLESFALSAGFDMIKISNCAHAIPFEEPKQWRNEVMDFLK